MALELVTDPGPWEPTRWRGATRLEQAHRLLSRVVLCQPLYRGPTEATAAQVRVLEMLGALPLRLNDCGNVAMARNAITARWLSDTSRPWSLWIDGDVSAVEGPLGWVEFVARSLECFPDGEAAICGCYPWRRRGGGRFAVGFDGGPVVLGLEGGYYRVRWCGGGALLLHRTAVELVARAKDLAPLRYRFDGAEHRGPRVWKNVVDLAPDGQYEEAGEDVGLSRALVAAGIDLWCDTRFRLDHEGSHRFTWEDALGPEPGRARSLTLSPGGPS